MTSTKPTSKAPASTPPLVDQCMQALSRMVTLQSWRWRSPRTQKERLVDGYLELRINGSLTRFAVVSRPALHEAHVGPLAHLREQVSEHGQRLLVCAGRIREHLGARLRELAIAYLDVAGSACFEAPGIVVRVTGRAPQGQKQLRMQLTATDLRLLHVLLRAGGTDNRNQRQLAEAAGIALGAVGKGLRALESHGLLRQRGATRWEIQDPAVAQARFAEGWATVLCRKLDARRYRALDPQWIERLPARLADLGDRCLLGGELAAARVTTNLHTQHATLHVAAGSQREIADALSLFADPDGPITMLERFGSGDSVPDAGRAGLLLAHPLLIHAELVAVGDERLVAVAKTLWQRWLDGVQRAS